MEPETGIRVPALRVAGGMTVNELLMQFRSDILNIPVVRPQTLETTSLGAAYAAGLAVGRWRGTDDLVRNWAVDRRWEPSMDADRGENLAASWKKAVDRSFGWAT
jgi:glycerol kinase